MKIEYPGRIIDGQLKITGRKHFDREISSVKDCYVKVIIQRLRKTRSNQQNRYWHGVVIKMLQDGFEDLGHKLDHDEVHDFVKHKFCRTELVNEETGEILETVKGTSKMTTTEMMDLIDTIQQWATIYMNINIPDPDPNYYQITKSDT